MNGEVGLLVNSLGQPSSSTVVIPDRTIAVGFAANYLLSLGDGALGVYDFMNDTESDSDGMAATSSSSIGDTVAS